jgi:hypothetical protein
VGSRGPHRSRDRIGDIDRSVAFCGVFGSREIGRIPIKDEAAARPKARPVARPKAKPVTRPTTKPVTRPETKPGG